MAGIVTPRRTHPVFHAPRHRVYELVHPSRGVRFEPAGEHTSVHDHAMSAEENVWGGGFMVGTHLAKFMTYSRMLVLRFCYTLC